MSEEKMTNRKLQALQTKNKIYQIVVREINKKGISNVSVSDITKAANVAKGTFYIHFESKEALIHYTFKQSDAIYEQAYEKVKDLSFIPQIKKFSRISYEEYEKRGKGIIKAIISNYFVEPERDIYNRDRLLYKCLEKIVENRKAEALIKQETFIDHCVNLFVSTLVGIEVMWCFDKTGLKLSDMIEDAMETTARGMIN